MGLGMDQNTQFIFFIHHIYARFREKLNPSFKSKF